MKFFSEIKRLFQNVDVVIAEQLDTAGASFAITYTVLPTIETFQEILDLVPKRDMAVITLVNDSDDIVTFTNHQTDVFDCSTLTEGLLSEDNINVRIQIDKTVMDGKFSIYDYDSFVTDLLARSLPEIMNWFSMRISGQDSLIFVALDYDVSFSTRTIAFESSEDALFTPMVSRLQHLSDCKDTACFYNMNIFEILPDDFIIQGIVRANNRLQIMLRTIRKNVYSIEAVEKPYRAAGYIRLSGVKDNQDRDSIENQKAIIEDVLAKKCDIALQNFYVDENDIGTSFEWKGLREILEDIAQGRIDCVAVKDLFRLGRDTIELSFYVRHPFPLKGVRFLSIHDDSDNDCHQLVVDSQASAVVKEIFAMAE